MVPGLNPWFASTERLAALSAEAARWRGTPFFPNSSSPGPKGGVSCQKLVAALYRGAGFCDVEEPDAPMAYARYSHSSLVEEFMRQRPEFRRYCEGGIAPTPEIVIPGDLLGFRIHRTVHHLGICLRDGVFVHAIEGLGVTESSLADPTWGSRLAVLWRPVES